MGEQRATAGWRDWVLVAFGVWPVVSPVTVGWAKLASLAWSDVLSSVAVAAVTPMGTGRA